MKKVYSLKIGEDIIPFEGISINEDGSPVIASNIPKIFAYENNPTVINLSDMESIPSTGDLYDPTLEKFPFVRRSSRPALTWEGYGKFALVVGDTVAAVMVFDLTTEIGYKISAAFSSNPEFLKPEIIE
jgi:hypothetical protein